MGFPPFLQMVNDGEAVAAGVVNRPTAALDQRTQYLLQLIDAAGLGSTVVARNVTVNPLAGIGTPVFYNSNTQQFDLALAIVNLRADNAVVVGSDCLPRTIGARDRRMEIQSHRGMFRSRRADIANLAANVLRCAARQRGESLREILPGARFVEQRRARLGPGADHCAADCAGARRRRGVRTARRRRELFYFAVAHQTD